MATGRRSGSRRSKVSAPRKYLHRPRVELLENRQLLSTYYVSNPNDGGPGSLRDAIDMANSDPIPNGQDIIEPTVANLGTIFPQSALPAVTRGDVTIEKLELDGSNAGSADWLDIQGSADAVVNVGITNFGGIGIYVTASAVQITQSQIESNIGTGIVIASSSALVSGKQVTNNSGDGIDVYGSDNKIGVVGGTASGAGNVISGNAECGISVTDDGTADNLIAGNEIGTDVTGSQPLGNAYQGIYFGSGTSGNTVGGTTAGAGNVISANGNDGIWIN
jgi:hypothetical protein